MKVRVRNATIYTNDASIKLTLRGDRGDMPDESDHGEVVIGGRVVGYYDWSKHVDSLTFTINFATDIDLEVDDGR